MSTKFWGIDKQHPTYRWHDFWSHDQVTNWKHHSTTITKATITTRGWNTYQNETLLFLHITWCNHVITWHTNTKFVGNANQNEWVPLFQFTWPNHAKVIKLQPLKLRWWKLSFLQDTWCLIMWYLDKWIASNYNFYKSFNELNLKDKKKNTFKMYLFSWFKD